MLTGGADRASGKEGQQRMHIGVYTYIYAVPTPCRILGMQMQSALDNKWMKPTTTTTNNLR
jgi:hypothetical protein